MYIKPRYGFLIVVLLIAVPLFNYLDALPMRMWDEARYAVNAFEMHRSHNWLINTHHGEPDMWALKPPFMIWMQVICMYIVGVGDLAVRLPSAIAAAITCIFLFFLFARRYREPWMGVISAIVLVTVKGYVVLHGSRSGDLDSMLTLFTTLHSIYFYLFIEEEQKKYWYLSCLFLVLGIYTKGIQALLVPPGLLIYAIWRRKLPALLRSKDTYMGILGVVALAAGFYLLRDHYNHGYIRAVWEGEIAGRYNTTIEEHTGNGFFYLDQVFYTQFRYWFWFAITGIVVGLCSTERWVKNITLFSTIVSLSYFLIISNAATKLEWYPMPIYPFMAILAAILVYSACKLLANMDVAKTGLKINPLPYLFLVIIFGNTYVEMIRYSFFTIEAFPNQPTDEMAYYLREALRHNREINGVYILQIPPVETTTWYVKLLERQGNTVPVAGYKDVPANGRVIAYTPETRKYIEDHYNFKVLLTEKNVVFYSLSGEKQPQQAN